MEPDYPENTVWYIEARRWSGTKENPGFVKRDEIFHDATTSGGVSGGPVVHRQSNTVIAMHIGGRFADVKKENYAFNLQALWNNPSFVEALQPYNVTTETIGARVNRDWIRSGDFIQTAPPSLNVGSKIITN